MKPRLATAVLALAALAFPLALSAMPTAVEYLPARLDLRQAVKLGDGSVLPAGHYDVQIHFKGFGNTAEFQFFRGGAFVGKTSAEARGFPSSPAVAIGGAGGEGLKKYQKADDKYQKADDAYTVKSEQASKVKIAESSAEAKVFPKVETTDKHSPGTAPASFSWKAAGFAPGQTGKSAISGNGKLKLSFDSANSAAGFAAILPYIEKKGK